MSPEAEAVARAIDREVGRARLAVAAESAALGAAIAAWSVTGGFLFALAFCVWRSRAASRRSVVRRLERVNPRAGNLLFTVEELSAGSLSVKPEIRTRVLRDAGVALRSSPAHSAAPAGRLILLVAVAAAAWVIVAGRIIRPVRSASAVRGAAVTGQTGIAPIAFRVTVTVEPPSYTGLPSTTTVDPVELRVVENSRIAVDIQSTSPGLSLEINDTKRTLAPGPEGRFTDREVIARSGYLLLTADDGGRRMVPIAVTPDALPEVRIVRPGRDLVFASGNPRISFEVRATDDYGLRSVSLRFTKISGSGEQYEFKDGQIPLSVAKASARAWKASAVLPLANLGLQEGDMLVYRAVASDVHPDDREASSDAYFIEISKIGAAAGDAFTLPEEETRYALSQQMLIIKTDRLSQRRGEMDGAAFVEAAQGLAVEQRMIRSEFVFMLGGEIEDEVVEAEQSIELQAGRLANRGQRDLRAATVAMSQAEKQLTDANTKEALAAERAAVAALQRAFARDRYILRALATRSQLDPARRLTGIVAQTMGWRRSLADGPASRRAVELQDLLRGLGEAVVKVRSPGADQRAQLAVLAALAVRIVSADTQSEPLRQAAADLQRLSDEWQTLAPDRRAEALDTAAALVAQEARRALADAPLTFGAAR